MAESQGGKTERVILVAYDGSDHAKYALKFYRDMIRRDEDKLILVYCVEVSDIIQQGNVMAAPFTMDHDLFKELVQKEVKRIETELIEFAKYMRELKVNGEVKSTHAHKPGEGIINTAEKEKASLIITGSRGLGKIRRTFLGSCSDYILHHASCPVLVCTGEHHLTE